MGIKTKVISYLLIISMIMTGFAYAAEGLNSSNEVSTYGQDFSSNYGQELSDVKTSDAKQSFSDIEDHWCQDVIKKFLSENWIAGYDDGLFRPDRFVTRAEFTAMVVNILKKDVNLEEAKFSDVNEDDWFYHAVSYALSEGLIAGYEDGTFRPMENMYRQDSAVVSSKSF